MLKQARTALGMLLALTLLTGVAYPLLVTGVAQAFPREATGSLTLGEDGKTKASLLIGQSFEEPKYFWSRLSATTPAYNGAASAGSNLGPTNDALRKAAEARIAALRAADPGNEAPVPVDLVTSSASGLDPHISPAAARYQLERVARVRALPEATVAALVAKHTEDRTFGVLGEPRVNVVALNLDLDAAH